ncbi:MAG: phosphate/phosphite/phosphonate ABC transporter substrate-binding protein [Actinomycetota bacterium]|nr:phosphate/phosphite/phosphonate ABC transporter substrate-binding protein [Actinomycetota bacterium]
MLATVAGVTAGCGERPEGAGAPSPQGAEEAGQPLRVGLVPNQEPDKVKAEYAALGQYMERQLGRKVELTVPTGYPAVVEAMANDKLDVALFGGLTYVQARQRAKVSPLVTDINPETGSTKYTASVIVPADSPVRRIEDLRGKTFAFGSVSSTSGSLYPALMLRKAGIDYRSALGRTTYTGGHDATAAAVASGKVDAGGLEGRILRRLVKKGTVDGAKIREIAVSDPIEGYPWVARDGLDPKLRDEIANLFLDLKDPRLLKLLNTKGYERVQASAYDSVERDATELALLTRTK